jgi:hypothetical protein
MPGAPGAELPLAGLTLSQVVDAVAVKFDVCDPWLVIVNGWFPA